MLLANEMMRSRRAGCAYTKTIACKSPCDVFAATWETISHGGGEYRELVNKSINRITVPGTFVHTCTAGYRASLRANVNNRVVAALARGSAAAQPQKWCLICKTGTHETKDCRNLPKANNGDGGKGGKANGGRGNEGKGGKGANDQTFYDKNGTIIWRSQADQAAHMAQKQQKRP